MAAALAELGVRGDTLTDGERAMLDTQGYLPLIGLLDPETLATLRSRFDELVRMEGEAAGAEFHQEPGTTRLADLVNKGEAFDVTHRHPRVLAGIHHVLGEFHLSSLNARAALPGHGPQGMHTDWHASVGASRPGAPCMPITASASTPSRPINASTSDRRPRHASPTPTASSSRSEGRE